MPDLRLCHWCEQRYQHMTSHDLHPDATSQQRLRADLARACDPRYCPPAKETK